MATHYDLTPADEIFFDAARLLVYTVYRGNPSAAEIAAGTAVPEDLTGADLIWVMRNKPHTPDPPLIEKTLGNDLAITGTYNASAALNTQRVEVQLRDTDTYDPAASPPVIIKPGQYAYALKRLDDGVETIYAYGKLALVRVAAWEAG